MIRVKICGITTPADAIAAVEAGADFLGLNFSTHSVRRITLEQAKPIVDALDSFSGLTGVFVEHSWDEIDSINRDLKLAHAQFYSTPWPQERFTSAGLIPAFRVRSTEDVQKIHVFLATSLKPQMIVVDSFVPGAMGGTGHKAPWELLAGQDFGVPLILAGGLTPENVAEAIHTVRPWGVDVASGVESSPGRKDASKVRAFVEAVRSV
jgi:phosphoribosylanthranilate isomerase